MDGYMYMIYSQIRVFEGQMMKLRKQNDRRAKSKVVKQEKFTSSIEIQIAFFFFIFFIINQISILFHFVLLYVINN